MRYTALLLAVGLVSCAEPEAPGIELPRALQQAMLNGLVNVEARLEVFGSGYSKAFPATPVTGSTLSLSYAGVPPGTYTFKVHLTGDFKSGVGIGLADFSAPNVNVVAGSHNDRTAIDADSTQWTAAPPTDSDGDGIDDLQEVLAGLDPGSPWTVLYEAAEDDPVVQLAGTDYRNIVFVTPTKKLRLFNQRVERTLPALTSAEAARVDDTAGILGNCCGSSCLLGPPNTAAAAHGEYFAFATGNDLETELTFGYIDVTSVADGTPGPNPQPVGFPVLPAYGDTANAFKGTITGLALPAGSDGLRVVVGTRPAVGGTAWFGRTSVGLNCPQSGLAFLSQVSPTPATAPALASLAACGTDDVVVARANGLQILHGEPTRPECSWDGFLMSPFTPPVALTAYSGSGTCYLLMATTDDGVGANTITRVPIDNLPTAGAACPTSGGGAVTAGRLEDAQLPDPAAFGRITAVHYGMSAVRETTDVIPEPITVLLIGDNQGHIYMSPLLGDITTFGRSSWTLLPALPNGDPGPVLSFVTDTMAADDANATFFRPLIVATPRAIYRYD